MTQKVPKRPKNASKDDPADSGQRVGQLWSYWESQVSLDRPFHGLLFGLFGGSGELFPKYKFSFWQIHPVSPFFFFGLNPVKRKITRASCKIKIDKGYWGNFSKATSFGSQKITKKIVNTLARRAGGKPFSLWESPDPDLGDSDSQIHTQEQENFFGCTPTNPQTPQ